MLSEIQFLTFVDETKIPNPVVVYAGAAPGIHIPELCKMFPHMKFYLYDPAPFGITITPEFQDQIFINHQADTGPNKGLFTDEIAHIWSGRNDVIFISDIRGDYYLIPDEIKSNVVEKAEYTKNNNKILNEDMRLQKNWVNIIKPKLASLKFRLPYYEPGVIDDDNYPYLDGFILKQTWVGQTSTECRLIVPETTSSASASAAFNGGTAGRYPEINYSIKAMEEKMFYHNSFIRERVRFENPFTNKDEAIDAPELLQEYDSIAESIILYNYLTKYRLDNTLDSIKNISRRITKMINTDNKTGKIVRDQTLSFYRTGPYKSSVARSLDKQALKKQQYEQVLHQRATFSSIPSHRGRGDSWMSSREGSTYRDAPADLQRELSREPTREMITRGGYRGRGRGGYRGSRGRGTH
jgi:hypothetical protein